MTNPQNSPSDMKNVQERDLAIMENMYPHLFKPPKVLVSTDDDFDPEKYAMPEGANAAGMYQIVQIFSEIKAKEEVGIYPVEITRGSDTYTAFGYDVKVGPDKVPRGKLVTIKEIYEEVNTYLKKINMIGIKM